MRAGELVAEHDVLVRWKARIEAALAACERGEDLGVANELVVELGSKDEPLRYNRGTPRVAALLGGECEPKDAIDNSTPVDEPFIVSTDGCEFVYHISGLEHGKTWVGLHSFDLTVRDDAGDLFKFLHAGDVHVVFGNQLVCDEARQVSAELVSTGTVRVTFSVSCPSLPSVYVVVTVFNTRVAAFDLRMCPESC